MAAITERAGSRARVGVDVGGTFTDLVALVDGELRIAKVSSTPGDQSNGVMAALDGIAIDADRVEAFAHGTTVATNALLERSGARTALLTTDGLQGRPRDRPPDASVALRPDPATARAARPARASVHGARARRPRRRDRAARRGRPGRGDRGAAGRRRRRGRRLLSLLVPRPRARAPRRRSAARRSSARADLAVERGAAGVSRVRAVLDDDRGRVSRPSAQPLPRAPWRAARCRGLPAAARHAVVGRRARPRPGSRSARRRACSPGRPPASSGLRYAAEVSGLPRSPDVRHGRHEHRRRPRGRRRGADDHRRRRRRASRSSTRWSTCTR